MAANPGPQPGASTFGFAKTFVLPALLIFLVPVASFFFFRHAQGRYDDQLRQALLAAVQKDHRLSKEERAQAVEFFTKVPASELVKHDKASEMFPAGIRFELTAFRWAIRLSAWSLVGGIAVLVFAGVCVLLSLHSNVVQYWTLLICWHVLRGYGAVQVVVQGALLVALSYWVTALWLQIYVPKLIFVVALMAVAAVILVIRGMFKRLHAKFEIDGILLAPETSPRLWDEIRRLCARIGTDPPDQIVAGIDANFFVSEQPVTVDGRTLVGRTLYVSLALLKQLDGQEADAVLAHEMAHFSGQDTVYSKKISPLLIRYGEYLESLGKGLMRPVFYFMLCFRALFELSLRRLERQRELRADQIAAQTTSREALAGALLRIAAYAKYRGQIEQGLFEQDRALEAVDIGTQVERGFPTYAALFASSPDLGTQQIPHPFDSHPPLARRLEAVGAGLGTGQASAALATPGDGLWYHSIQDADQIQRRQWDQFETQFRAIHEKSLAYRFLPSTDEERAIVVAAFPEVVFSGKSGTLTMDHERVHHSSWPGPLRFDEIAGLAISDKGVLTVQLNQRKSARTIKMKDFGREQQTVLNAIGQYYARHCAAVEYQKQKRAGTQPA